MSSKNHALQTRRKSHLESFSNYENAVTLISSLEAWCEYRWGQSGKAKAGLLERFGRFPNVDGLTPDFEVRFKTPYVIWGDHKRTIQPSVRNHDDAINQLIKYATRLPTTLEKTNKISGQTKKEAKSPKVDERCDVVVLVNSENDNIAAEAINRARVKHLNDSIKKKAGIPKIAPIIVLGCHRDYESINKEWFKVKWRDHHDNNKFSSPNVSADSAVEDLNRIFVESTHHVIPVKKAAAGLSGRNPFINDDPPPLYTAVRVVIPAINALLTDDERDQLQSTGFVEKSVSIAELRASDVIASMAPQPARIEKWLQAALDFLNNEVNRVHRVSGTSPQRYLVTVDSFLIKGDPRELFSDRAAARAAKLAARSNKNRGSKGDSPGQMKMFGL